MHLSTHSPVNNTVKPKSKYPDIITLGSSSGALN